MSLPLIPINFRWRKRGLCTKELMSFCRQLSTMTACGLGIVSSLELIKGETENIRLKEKVLEVIKQVERGNSLKSSFNAIKDFFPPLLVNMVGAGEAVGKLPLVLDTLSLHFERQYDMEQRLHTATLYPKFVMITVLAVIIFLLSVVLPNFVNFFSAMGVETPFITLLLLYVGNTFLSYWPVFFVTFFLLLFSWKRFSQTEKGMYIKDWFSIKWPLFGDIYYKILVARFCRTLSTLLCSGIGLLSALELASKVLNNKVAQRSIEQLEINIYRGDTISFAVGKSSFFPPMVAKMAQVGEETGTIDSSLARAADFFEGEASYMVERLNYKLEPFLIIFLSFIVGIVIFSFLMPMMDVLTTI